MAEVCDSCGQNLKPIGGCDRLTSFYKCKNADCQRNSSFLLVLDGGKEKKWINALVINPEIGSASLVPASQLT